MTQAYKKLDGITILVADDSSPFLSMTRSLLHSFGIKNILKASNGNEALYKIEQNNPDLLLSDWAMEPMNGIALTEHLRKKTDSPNAKIPVIIMSAYSRESMVCRARDAGAHDFIAKPFNARALYRRIINTLENPRPFIDIKSYFGPDRRRQNSPIFCGPFRRADDYTLDRKYEARKAPEKPQSLFSHRADTIDLSAIDFINKA